jgi:hypothetical protein
MRYIVFVVVALLATACGDNRAAPGDDAGPSIDAGVDGGPGPAALAPCLDRPTDLSVIPGQLPCELLPPGFKP